MNDYIKLAGEDLKVFNDTFIEQVDAGNTKEAQVSLQSFTRNRLREDSFAEKIITPIDVNNDELDKALDPEFLVKYCDREPDNVPAMTIPLGTTPNKYEFSGTRYPVYFTRISSDMYEKDVDLLRGYTYDIRSVLLEQNTKDIGTTIDTHFLSKINDVIGAVNTNNPLNGLGLPQNITISGGVTRSNISESFKTLTRLKVPFGPMQKDGSDSKGVILANVNTAIDITKFERSEAGGNISEKMWIDGEIPNVVNGVKIITTIKDDLVPDGVFYMFSSEEYLGRYLLLQALTAFMKNEAYFLQFMQYLNIGMSIGNVKGAARVEFI